MLVAPLISSQQRSLPLQGRAIPSYTANTANTAYTATASAATATTTCLSARKNNKEDKEEDKEDNKGLLGNLNFWPGPKEEEPPEQFERREGEGILFSIFNRGNDDEEDGYDNKRAAKEAKKKRRSDKKKNGNEGRDEDSDDNAGFLKGFTNRFGGNKVEEEPEEDPDNNPFFKLPIDNRPTFVALQRPPPENKVPKPGSRIMPSGIKKTPKKPTPTPQAAKTKEPTKPRPPPKPSRTIRLIQKVTSNSKGKDNNSNEDGQDKDALSVFGRVSKMFATNSTTEEDVDASKSNKASSSTPLAKFMSNLVDTRVAKKEQWVPVFPKTRLSPGEIVPVEVMGIDLIVVASKDAQNIYCMVNSCPHLGTPLEVGFLERRPIEYGRGDTKSESNKDVQLPSKTINPKLQESDVAAMLANDGCEDCIVCPLHKTAFALKSGEVRGEWCPYPPILGKMTAAVKNANSAAVFDVRTRGKNIEVRLNSPLLADLDGANDGEGKK